MPVIVGILGDPVAEEGAVAGQARDLAGQAAVAAGGGAGTGALAAMRPAARHAQVATCRSLSRPLRGCCGRFA